MFCIDVAEARLEAESVMFGCLDAGRAKYRLLGTVREQKGAMDDCFNSLYQREDDDRKVGVSPAREFMAVTDDALETNGDRKSVV